MGWRPIEYRDAVFAEELVRDDTLWRIGSVMRFYSDAPTYAYHVGVRLGAFSNDAAAKEAVEQARLAFREPGSAL